MALRSTFWRHVVMAVALFGCAEGDTGDTVERRERLTVGGEVYRVFCKRAAAEAFPDDLEGTQFNAPCEGKGPSPRKDARFSALLSRRDVIVRALDRVLGDDAAQARGEVSALLGDDELASFLKKTLPLYDPPNERLPELTRALVRILDRVIDENDALGKQALEAIAKSTGRVGYRPLQLALGVARPLLEYPRIDELTAQSLEMLREGGKSEKTFDALVRAISLELATAEDTPPAPDSTFALTRELLLSNLEGLDEEVERTPLWLVRRDGRGVALPERVESKLPLPFVDLDGDDRADIDNFGRILALGDLPHAPAPFAIPSEETVARDPDGRALNVWEPKATLLYNHLDVQTTVLSGIAREQRLLLTPKKVGDRTTVDKIARGLPALLGKFGERTATYGSSTINFRGPDLSTAPALDLIHAVGVIAKNPDTPKVLEVLKLQLRDHEAESAALIDTLLKIDARADAHPEAVLIGKNGPGTPHDFWDDLIKIGVRMTERPGLIEALMRSFLDARAPAQGPLIGNWMRYKDPVTYPNAPSTDPKDINQLATRTYSELVDRTKPDLGKNRSLFQRTLGLVHGLHGQKQCNKNNAKLNVHLGPLPLTLPLTGPGYKPCELFEVRDLVEIHVLSVLGRARIDLKPGDLKALGGLCPVIDATCLGQTQEKESQIVGFDDTPTPTALARFVFAPPNAFVKGFVDPVNTLDGVPIAEWEPYALFPMEVVDPMAKPFGAPPEHPGLSFLDAGYTLFQAFDDHELRDESGALKDGYLFGDLMSTLHMHWSSRRAEPCDGPPQETCTQSLDPSAKFFTHQTNIVSYEPLIAEALVDERLLDRLHEATRALAETTVDGEDGITILSRFVTSLLRPDPSLRYRDGTTTAKTNTGSDLGYVSPLYLLLDALKASDASFATDEHSARLPVWREARSELVDTMFGVEEKEGKKRMKDRIGRALSMRVLSFVEDRISAHKAASDLDSWADSFATRAEEVLRKPIVPAAIALLDETYDNAKAAEELAALMKYLFEEEGEGFASSLLAGADLLQLLDDAAVTAPILKLAADAAAPGVLSAVETGKKFNVKDGIARAFVELQFAMSQADNGRPSTTAKLMRNVVAASMEDGRSPLETLLEAVAEIRRVDPNAKSDDPLDAADLRSVLKSVRDFLGDEERGLERFYSVVQNRQLEKN